MVSNPTSANEIKETVLSIKISKSIGYNETNFSVTRNCCAAFFLSLLNIHIINLEKNQPR